MNRAPSIAAADGPAPRRAPLLGARGGRRRCGVHRVGDGPVADPPPAPPTAAPAEAAAERTR